MYLGHDYSSQVNPHILPYQRFRLKDGFFESGNAVCVVDVETILIQFDTFGLKKTILSLTFIGASWVGSPTGTLLIKENDAVVQEYNSEIMNDIGISDSFVWPIWAEINPWKTCKIIYINQTDTLAIRNMQAYITGQIG